MIEKILEYIKKLFTRFNFIIRMVYVAFIPITIAIIYVLNYLEKYIPSLKNGLLLFILIVFIVFLVISIYNNFNKFTKIKTEIKQNKTRKIICDAYGSLNPYFMSQFIRYLEKT